MRFLLFLLLLYVAWGLYDSNFYTSMAERRARLALASKEDMEIGVVTIDDPGDTYRTGVEVGIAELNAGGIHPPTGPTRRITLVYLDIGIQQLEVEDFGIKLTNLLASHPRMVALMAGVPTRFAEKTDVICQSYGVGLLLSSPRNLRNSAANDNTIFLLPSMNVLDNQVNLNLPLLVPGKAETDLIRVGLLNDAEPFQAGLTSHTYLQSLAEMIQFGRAGNLLYKAMTQGEINGKLTLSQLSANPFLQAGITNHVEDIGFLVGQDGLRLPSNLSLEEALRLLKVPRPDGELSFIHTFTPQEPEYAELFASVGEHKPDLLVNLGYLRHTPQMIRELRRVRINTPIVVFQTLSPEVFLDQFEQAAENTIVVSTVNPNDQTADFLDFQRRFTARAESQQRKGKAPDDVGQAGYESILLLKAAVEATGSTVPTSIIHSIKFPVQELRFGGQVLSFDQAGWPLQRKVHLLRYTGGGFQPLNL